MKGTVVVGNTVVGNVLTRCTWLHTVCNLKPYRWTCNVAKFGKSCITNSYWVQWRRSNQKHLFCERWRRFWSQYTNQIVEDISLTSRDARRSDKVRWTSNHRSWSRAPNLWKQIWQVALRLSCEASLASSYILSIFRYLHDLYKSTQSCWIVPYVTKILEIFWLTLVFYKYQTDNCQWDLFEFVPVMKPFNFVPFTLLWVYLFGLWHIKLCRLLNAKSIYIHINSSTSSNSV